MKVAGVIAEYNPFHNGHQWHLQEARQAGATHIVAVMGGDFLQRGAPALMEKRERAAAALACGADLVLELPLPYACATAERFAFGGVVTLQALGCVDVLSFGSESGDLKALQNAAALLDDPRLSQALAPHLGTGMTFAAARQKAVDALGGEEASAILTRPNNILAVEYLRQLTRLASPIAPETVRREGADHDQDTPGEENMASASFLRSLAEQNHLQEMSPYMPEASYRLFFKAAREGRQIDPARMELPLLAKLRTMTLAEFRQLPDVSEGLENRIISAVKEGGGLQDILARLKTKRYTHARLRRILLSAWLGLEANMNREAPPYIRVLGMNHLGAEVLSQAKRTAWLPVSHSLARLESAGPRAAQFAKLESRSVDLYNLLTPTVGPCGTDYTAGMLRG